MKAQQSHVDVLVVATHPDDAEATIGGTIAKLTQSGCSVAVVDASRGEMGTRGTVDDRKKEAARAARSLRLAWRANLELPDARIVASPPAREALARVIRNAKPWLLIGPWWVSDLHPDHAAVGLMTRQAFFLSGLQKLDPESAPHRPKHLLYYASHDRFEPHFVSALTEAHFNAKIRALECYATQVRSTSRRDKGQHFVFGRGFFERVLARTRHDGILIGAPYGEGFRSEAILSEENPIHMLLTGAHRVRSAERS
ncbi:MAG: bacillithiol biosynthesis deacetylase BshB1 [Planctomycetes bacterium]|nr:bacillithiol biosynthesis deacetylase BshB1 [Planctomycetota bacterium]